jgi:hypothetical protein
MLNPTGDHQDASGLPRRSSSGEVDATDSAAGIVSHRKSEARNAFDFDCPTGGVDPRFGSRKHRWDSWRDTLRESNYPTGIPRTRFPGKRFEMPRGGKRRAESQARRNGLRMASRGSRARVGGRLCGVRGRGEGRGRPFSRMAPSGGTAQHACSGPTKVGVRRLGRPSPELGRRPASSAAGIVERRTAGCRYQSGWVLPGEAPHRADSLARPDAPQDSP